MDQPMTFVRESGPDTPRGTGPLPSDLLTRSVGRLRVLATLYGSVFFLGGTLPMLLNTRDRAQLFASAWQWGPQLAAVLMAVVVVLTLSRPGLAIGRALTIGVLFEIAASYCIVLSELVDTRRLEPGTVSLVMGMSWVGVWTMLFTIVIPSPPRRALWTALASLSAVPVTAGALILTGLSPLRPDPLQFFFWLVFPYLLVALMAYVGARVVYDLGTQVRQARELGSYHLEQKLGEGGMGEVWRARHRLLARPAAIKLIRAGKDGIRAETLQRFEREAQTIASLRSPHTVNLFDFGVDDGGGFYYVMELLDGLDTDKLVRRFGPVPAGRAIHILRQVCHSLSEAESRRLVHRDIKPANIFLCRYGEEYDFVKVLDFGIVKTHEEDVTPGEMRTADDVLPGTPAFMAPEQVTGGTLDGRTDIYAIGCVAYWLLTGQLVFEAPTPYALLAHHARSIPAAPSTRSELPIPAGLDRLVLDCLEKDPALRPQSARELGRALAAVDLSPWTEVESRKWWEATRI